MYSACAPFLAAYHATLYRIGPPRQPVVARLDGRRQPALDRLLARHGVREATFLTAWNPGSRPAGRAFNRGAQARLRARLGRVLPGFGAWAEDPARGEESLLALGLGARRGAALGRAFRQNAVVALRRGAPPRLLRLR